MKKIIGSLLFAAVTLAAGQSFAVSSGEVMAGCASSISGDSGKTVKLGEADVFGGDSCSCSAVANGQCYMVGTCSGNYQHSGYVVNGESCCVNPYLSCPGGGWSAEEEAAVEEIVTSADAESLEAAFTSGMNYYAYFGYVDGVSKSPSFGRSVSQDAKLDACIGHGNVDYIRDNVATFNQLSTCRGASYCGSSHNGACTKTEANQEQLCQDRCDCVFNGTCNGY